MMNGISGKIWRFAILFFIVIAAADGKGKKPALYRERPAEFSHLLHLEGGIGCEDCHPSARESDEAGMPAPETSPTSRAISSIR